MNDDIGELRARAAGAEYMLDWWLAENTYEAVCRCGNSLNFGQQVVRANRERDEARADVLALHDAIGSLRRVFGMDDDWPADAERLWQDERLMDYEQYR